MNPLVSVCIPTYNGEKYLQEALESLLNQTYSNLEIVVSDDRSSDNTLKILHSYKTRSKIPFKIESHEPTGIGANWNHCLKFASGKYVKFLFQDDTLHPECISRLMSYANSFPEAGLIYSRRNFIIEDPTNVSQEFIDYYGTLHTHWEDLIVNDGCISGQEYLRDRAFLNSPKNKIGEPSNVLLKRSVFEDIGFFDENMKQALDSDYWYRVMTKYDVVFINEALANFRLHSKQASTINKENRELDQDLIYKSYYHNLLPYLHPKNRLKLLKQYHPFYKALVSIKRTLYGKN